MWYERLVQLKKESGKTTKEISELSGVAVGTLNKLFAGQTTAPKIDTLTAVVHAIGYTLDDLEETKNSPSAEAAPGGKTFSMEASTKVLLDAGFIQEGQQISDDDLAFIENVFGILAAWFRKGK